MSSYNAQAAVPASDDEIRQVVEIGLVNASTQRARSIVDRQVWRYDGPLKRWWLVSGLPDISRAE